MPHHATGAPPAPFLSAAFPWLVALTVVNTVLLGSMVLGPQLFPFARRQFYAGQPDPADASHFTIA